MTGSDETCLGTSGVQSPLGTAGDAAALLAVSCTFLSAAACSLSLSSLLLWRVMDCSTAQLQSESGIYPGHSLCRSARWWQPIETALATVCSAKAAGHCRGPSGLPPVLHSNCWAPTVMRSGGVTSPRLLPSVVIALAKTWPTMRLTDALLASLSLCSMWRVGGSDTDCAGAVMRLQRGTVMQLASTPEQRMGDGSPASPAPSSMHQAQLSCLS